MPHRTMKSSASSGVSCDISQLTISGSAFPSGDAPSRYELRFDFRRDPRRARDDVRTACTGLQRLIGGTATPGLDFGRGSTCKIHAGGMPCRLTNIVAKSAARRSNTLNISRSMKPPIRTAPSAEANRFNTYPRRLSQRRRERAERSPHQFAFCCGDTSQNE